MNFEKKILSIDKETFYNLINLSNNLYLPLRKFNNKKEFLSIINRNKIFNKYVWTIPILFYIHQKKIKLKRNFLYLIKHENKIIGYFKFYEFFKIDKKNYNKKIFKTNNIKHPGVAQILKRENEYINADVYLFNNQTKNNFYLTKLLNLKKNKYKLNSSAAFTTRNICHNGHSFIINQVLNNIKKVFVIIISNNVNKYNVNGIFKFYNILKKNKFKNKIEILNIYLPKFFAGPKEAIFQSQIITNIGIKKIIIGRDHAGFKNFFGKYDSQKIFNKFKGFNKRVIKTKEPRLCKTCFKVGFENYFSFCRLHKNPVKTFPMDGSKLKEKIIKRKFNDLKGYFDTYMINFIKKNKNFLLKT